MSTTLYAVGLIAASMCTDEPIEQALESANALEHPGVGCGWQLSKDATFKTGESNPAPCEQNPATHRHYLLEC